MFFFDRGSLYNLVNKATLVHSLFLVQLFLVYLSISTCFGRLCAHHQEKQMCLCDTWYLLFYVDDCLVCRSIRSCIPDSLPHPCHQQAALPVHYNTSCKQSLVLRRMGEIIARNTLS